VSTEEAQEAASLAEGSPAEGSPVQTAVVHAPTRGELAWYSFARFVVFGLCWLIWRMRFVGTENLPQTTPYVVAPVHRSYIDAVLAGLVTRRRFRFMGKGEMWETPWVARLFTSLGGFPVRRGTPDRVALKMCEQALLAGEPVVLFPEGTRQSGPIVHPLFAGTAFVALRANVPIVPVGIGGSERAMPKGSRWLRPGRIALVVGRPIWPPPVTGSSRASRRLVQELTERLHGDRRSLRRCRAHPEPGTQSPGTRSLAPGAWHSKTVSAAPGTSRWQSPSPAGPVACA
jgi:1-acyl-sn-glycerol-3-phosphate acyltransferase